MSTFLFFCWTVILRGYATFVLDHRQQGLCHHASEPPSGLRIMIRAKILLATCLNSLYLLSSWSAHRPGQWNELIKYDQKAKISLTHHQASQRMRLAQFVRFPLMGSFKLACLVDEVPAGKGCPELVCSELHSTQSKCMLSSKNSLTAHSQGSAGLRPPWTHPWCLLLNIFTSSLVWFFFSFHILHLGWGGGSLLH